jgi:hypothetical protein
MSSDRPLFRSTSRSSSCSTASLSTVSKTYTLTWVLIIVAVLVVVILAVASGIVYHQAQFEQKRIEQDLDELESHLEAVSGAIERHGIKTDFDAVRFYECFEKLTRLNAELRTKRLKNASLEKVKQANSIVGKIEQQLKIIPDQLQRSRSFMNRATNWDGYDTERKKLDKSVSYFDILDGR